MAYAFVHEAVPTLPEYKYQREVVDQVKHMTKLRRISLQRKLRQNGLHDPFSEL